MLSIQFWAESLGIPVEPVVSKPRGTNEALKRSAREVAVRAAVLHGVAARARGMDAKTVLDWFLAQKIQREVSPREISFLHNPRPGKTEIMIMNWHGEAEWALLWSLGLVDALGLPTRVCDAHRMASVPVPFPAIGANLKPFLKQAALRPGAQIMGENERIVKLWHHAKSVERERGKLPGDLNLNVLYERRYAFEWLYGDAEWDKVTFGA